MVRETREGISRMLEIIEVLEVTKGNYNIGGSATAAAFGRGGVPKETNYISYRVKEEESIDQRGA